MLCDFLVVSIYIYLFIYRHYAFDSPVALPLDDECEVCLDSLWGPLAYSPYVAMSIGLV